MLDQRLRDSSSLLDCFIAVVGYSVSSESGSGVDDCQGIAVSRSSSSMAQAALSGKSFKSITGSLEGSGSLEFVGEFSFGSGESLPSIKTSVRPVRLPTTSLMEVVKEVEIAFSEDSFAVAILVPTLSTWVAVWVWVSSRHLTRYPIRARSATANKLSVFLTEPSVSY